MTDIKSTIARSEVGDEMPLSPTPGFIVIPGFFSNHESLRAQFEWRFTISRAHGTNHFTENTETGKYLIASINRIFTQQIITSFLSRLRAWARTGIGVNHASSPELHVFPGDCCRLPFQDTTPAGWRYFYSLGPRQGGLTHITLLDRATLRSTPILGLTNTVAVELEYNSLLAFRSEFACGVEKAAKGSEDILSSTALLTGYLW